MYSDVSVSGGQLQRHDQTDFMRVIAGSAGGLRLTTPKTGGVRPTMDRVKAAIFSSLGEAIVGAHVLDLYAGSGALGIEALSRGAADAVFVDRSRDAALTIEANLIHTGLTGQVICADAPTWIARQAGTTQFDIVFADPPYAKTPGDFNHGQALFTSADLAALLADDGVFILEILPRETLAPSAHLELFRSRRYGKTETAWVRKKVADP